MMLVLMAALLAAPLAAEPLAVGSLGYAVDLPEGWRMIEGAEGSVQSFADPSRTALLQVFSFASGSFASSEELARVIGERLGAKGEGAAYLYSGADATIADLRFAAGRTPARGYAVFLRGDPTDYALLAFAPEASFWQHHDALLSALDSFCPQARLGNAPGPVAQFASPFPAQREGSVTIAVGGHTLTVPTGADEQDAGQDLVEREARILAAETRRFLPAWQRFFRVIYRDNLLRLASVGEQLAVVLSDLEPRARAEALLAWIQGFRYARTGTVSDLSSPLRCLAEAAGDCDSRALLYVMLLHHMGLDAVLLVSTEYRHSAVGVAVEGAGARISAAGRSYVFAEVTDKVALGLVASDQADPKGWIPVVLPGQPAAP